MADTPQYLSLKHNRDGANRVELLARRIVFALVLAVAAAGLANVFGQEPSSSLAAAGGTTLEVEAPTALRGGLFYQGRFTVSAGADIEAATLVLERGWLEQMHVNTIEPAPVGEASRGDRLALDFGHLAAGDRLVVHMQFQVNPAQIGRRPQGVALYDGETPLAAVERTVTVYP